MDAPEPFYLVGPTASGKTAAAIELAEQFGGEIVNADAFQLYEGMDICTAKPPQAELRRVPHHLFGIVPLSESCDAHRYAELAHPVIADIQSRGRTPMITGGSGLYVKSLTHGLDDLPSDEKLRAKLSQLTCNERIGWLSKKDPDAAKHIDLRNDRRVSRALEICLLTGRPLSGLRNAWLKNPSSCHGVRLTMHRDELNFRIAQRIRHMIDTGLVEEIRNLPTLTPTAEKAIGVREIRSYLDGKATLSEAVAAIQVATRQYARRQEKWFKREAALIPIAVSASDSAKEVVRAILAAVPSLLESIARASGPTGSGGHE